MKRFNAMVRRYVKKFSVQSHVDGSIIIDAILRDGVRPFGVLDRIALAEMVEARLNAALREARP